MRAGHPQLLTRDEVARAITAEVKPVAARRNGGVFLDIASRVPAETIKRKLPSMYHPVHGAGRGRHHEGADGGRPDAPLLHGLAFASHSRLAGDDRARACSRVANAPARPARCEPARWPTRLSDLIVFGKLRRGWRDGVHRQAEDAAAAPSTSRSRRRFRRATEILNRETGANPYLLHGKLEETMTKGVGIVRKKEELEKAIEELEALKPSKPRR